MDAAGVVVCKELTTVGGTGEGSMGAGVAVEAMGVEIGVCRGLATAGGIGDAWIGVRLEVEVATTVVSGSIDGEGEVAQETTSKTPQESRIA
jgi:hypothetical protein